MQLIGLRVVTQGLNFSWAHWDWVIFVSVSELPPFLFIHVLHHTPVSPLPPHIHLPYGWDFHMHSTFFLFKNVGDSTHSTSFPKCYSVSLAHVNCDSYEQLNPDSIKLSAEPVMIWNFLFLFMFSVSLLFFISHPVLFIINIIHSLCQ